MNLKLRYICTEPGIFDKNELFFAPNCWNPQNLNLIRFIKKKLEKLDKHTRDVIEKSFYSTIVRVLGIVFTIGVSVALGRFLGTEGIGIINLGNQRQRYFLHYLSITLECLSITQLLCLMQYLERKMNFLELQNMELSKRMMIGEKKPITCLLLKLPF